MALLIKRRKKKNIFWNLFLWVLFAGIIFLAFVAVLAVAIKLPDIANFEENRVVQSTNILRGGFEQGGSTITQQVVKNTLLTKEKTIIRKFKEIIIALKLERKYSKDEILNLYLNQIPYGSGAYGIEAAAETFFNKHAKDLGMLEAIYLASLPNAPSYFSPYGKHVKELDSRAIFTLGRMRYLGYITKEEYDSVIKEKIKFAPARTQGIIAPHFVIEVRD